MTCLLYSLYTTDICRTENDIPQIFLEHECIFLKVNVTFYDAVNMIHDVITTANYILLNSSLSMLKTIQLNKTNIER